MVLKFKYLCIQLQHFSRCWIKLSLIFVYTLWRNYIYSTTLHWNEISFSQQHATAVDDLGSVLVIIWVYLVDPNDSLLGLELRGSTGVPHEPPSTCSVYSLKHSTAPFYGLFENWHNHTLRCCRNSASSLLALTFDYSV